MVFEDRIQKYKNKLNNTENIIVDYILKNKNEVCKLTVKELASKLYLAPNSIMRFCKKLNYTGFSEMKILLKEEIDKRYIRTKNNSLEDSIFNTINLIDKDIIEKTAYLLKKSKEIIIYGKGQNILIAEIFYKELKIVLNSVLFFNQRHELIYKIHELNKNATIFLISQSGETQELIEIAQIAKQKECNIISLTNIGKNTLQTMSDINLYCYSQIISLNNYEIQNNISFLIILRAILEKVILIV
ncbi:MurR/RpiR family transcriptional regulator [[Clostridium] colinum]|uniref:MurR/RpiR family transcriptional regulator n=1 Tax=[Clostridium] colinum TaxID=36835 RepID=UPI002025989E|nr:MurR/RpiR family transcriptional regulator [[Clostridium] colinum]